MKTRILGIRALLIVLCCALLFGGVLLGGRDSAAASSAEQSIEEPTTESYTISYEDFNHVKPGPSVTMPPDTQEA